jgi:hypothetical protein
MRRLHLIPIAVLLLVPLVSAAEATLDRYDDLLERYVASNSVRYDAWRDSTADHEALTEIVATLEATNPAVLEAEDRFALYINLYNAKTLQLVLDGNPENSIRDLSKARFGFGIFYKKLIEFDGETISLTALEKRLRGESEDPRIHFAVNCASLSCPALLDEAFRGERLDAQLEQQSFAYLERSDALLVDEHPNGRLSVRLSKIFDWYADDFGGAAGVRKFVLDYAPETIKARLGDGKFKPTHMKYDWSLNRAD